MAQQSCHAQGQQVYFSRDDRLYLDSECTAKMVQGLAISFSVLRPTKVQLNTGPDAVARVEARPIDAQNTNE